jgi:hypothetical protein
MLRRQAYNPGVSQVYYAGYVTPEGWTRRRARTRDVTPQVPAPRVNSYAKAGPCDPRTTNGHCLPQSRQPGTRVR